MYLEANHIYQIQPNGSRQWPEHLEKQAKLVTKEVNSHNRYDDRPDSANGLGFQCTHRNIAITAIFWESVDGG